MTVAHHFATAATDEGLKLLVLLAAIVGLLWLGRWSSSLGAGSSSRYPGALSDLDNDGLAGENIQPNPFAPAGDEIAASFPYDPSLGTIRMKKFFFEKVDALSGPPDPNVFADELHIELYEPDSGSVWWQSYFVATPSGLSQILRDKSWKYLHAPEILVLPRYDLEEIRRAAASRIVADHEFFKARPESEEAL
ncbi:MAG: hypothetical protein ABSH02_18990 [Candidatus Sulfotelmatobacter sp.]|jgi:hypothetical protein